MMPTFVIGSCLLALNTTWYSSFKDLEEVFGELCKYDIRLNSEKCTFGVNKGKFLGFMITHQGIEANPDKCTTIMEMHSPANA